MNALVNQAVNAFRRGNLSAAEQHARTLTRKLPNQPAGWKLLGAALQAQSRNGDALPAFEACTRLSPKDPEAHFNLGVALQSLGRLADAVAAYDAALRIEPAFAEAHYNRGVTCKELGRTEDSLSAFERAIRLRPDMALARHGSGSILATLGRYEEALAALDAAIRLKPGLLAAHWDRCTLLVRMGRREEALADFDGILKASPNDAEAHGGRGRVLLSLERLEEAVAAFDEAIRLKPDMVDVRQSRGVALLQLGQVDQALANFDDILTVDPNSAEAHSNRATVLARLDRLEEAIAGFDAALHLEPDAPVTLNNRAQLLADLGRPAEARADYGRALQLMPGQAGWQIQMALALPRVLSEKAEIADVRARLAADIELLTAPAAAIDNPVQDVGKTLFYLAYHGLDDRPIMEAARLMFRRRCPVLNPVLRSADGYRGPGDRIRVGFLSEFLYSHTIGKLVQGVLRNIDRTRFHVTVCHTPKTKSDGVRAAIDQAADAVVELSRHLPSAQRQVAGLALDVLYYPDIGMSPFTYYLAYSRLAPVQAVSWGHPDTTGLDTIDYFLSPDGGEAAGAEGHYTETLLRLSRLPAWYEPFVAPTQAPLRADLGLPEDATLYGCPQSLFKFHPDFDTVLAEIADRDPRARFVLIEGTIKPWTGLLQARWSRTHPVLLDRAVWLPKLGQTRFMTMLARLDLLLDPIHFGSGNTLYEGMVYGVPYVTWPGDFMRGRLVAAAYRQLGVEDAPVAGSIEDYARVAVEFGANPDRRRALKQELLAKGPALFRDTATVREFEAFLEAAAVAAAEGRRLTSDWRWRGA